MKRSILIACIALVLTTTCYAAGGDDVLGVWNNGEKDAKIEIVKCGDKLLREHRVAQDADYPKAQRTESPERRNSTITTPTRI